MRTTYNYNVMWHTREIVIACIRECMGKYDSFCYVKKETKSSAFLNSIIKLRYSKSNIINKALYAMVTVSDKIEINTFESSFSACYLCFEFDGTVVDVLVSNKEAWEVLVKLIRSLGRIYVG